MTLICNIITSFSLILKYYTFIGGTTFKINFGKNKN